MVSVLYRKYRPQTLSDLVGQSHVTQAILAAFNGGKLAHAYLFSGPRGVGKTSTARILAKMVNCEKLAVSNPQPSDKNTENHQAKPDDSLIPCNHCPTCLAITEGSHLDVVEMDAASNRGIDDIRTLRDNIKLATTQARKKVYIIDEVHMLSNDAFNALLKTLEEPPEHVLFILATTEVQKVPVTILSRLQRFDFKMATVEEIAEALRRVAKAEKIDIEDEAITAVAKSAQGSFRDGIKLLDQLSALGKIDLALVEKTLGAGAATEIDGLLSEIAQHESTAALTRITALTSQGANVKELTLLILDSLRQLLLIKNGLGVVLVKPEIGEARLKTLEKIARVIGWPDLLYSLDCFQKSLEQSRYVTIPTLPLELAVAKSSLGRIDSIPNQKEELAQKTEPKPSSDTASPSIQEALEQIKEDVVPVIQVQEKPSAQSAENNQNINQDIQKITDHWTYILETVRQYNYSLEALLRLVKLSSAGDNVVTVEVPYSFHQRILEAPKSRDLLESILSDILGKSVKVNTVLGKKPLKRDEVANIEVAADDDIIRAAAEIFNSEVN